MKIKRITSQGKTFLFRFSQTTRKGSVKLHVIVGDDLDPPHKHPWNFSTFLLLGAYKEWVNGEKLKHRPFTVVKRSSKDHHKVSLYRVFGVKIPCVTVGFYSQKIEPWCNGSPLCDSCQKAGYCADKKYWQGVYSQEV